MFGGFSILVFRGIELVGVQIEYSSPYFIGFSAVFLLAFLFVLVNLQVNWTLVSVIVVVEFNWSLTALRRSVDLIKAMKEIGLSSLLFLVMFTGILVWTSSVSSTGSNNNEEKNWGLIVQIVVASTLIMLLLLHKTASNAVLYAYCKTIHGELAHDIAEEFTYVSLPFDDHGKVPHVVSIIHE